MSNKTYLIKEETLTSIADKIRGVQNTPATKFTPKDMTNYITGSGTHTIKLTNNTNDFFQAANSSGGYGKILFIKPDLTPGIISYNGFVNMATSYFDVYANSPIFITWRNNNGYDIRKANGTLIMDFGNGEPFFAGFIATPTLEIVIEKSNSSEPE